MTGVVILVLLMATAVVVFLRNRRGLLRGKSGRGRPQDHGATTGDPSLTIGGPFSGGEFGGFGGARRPTD